MSRHKSLCPLNIMDFFQKTCLKMQNYAEIIIQGGFDLDLPEIEILERVFLSVYKCVRLVNEHMFYSLQREISGICF